MPCLLAPRPLTDHEQLFAGREMGLLCDELDGRTHRADGSWSQQPVAAKSAVLPTRTPVRQRLQSWTALVCCLLASVWLCWPRGLTVPLDLAVTSPAEPQYLTKNIEDIKVGDMVLARDEFGNDIVLREVVEVYRRTSDQLRVLTFCDEHGNEQTLETTNEHPFWVVQKNDFIDAGDLKVGNQVTSPHGDLQTLVATTLVPKPDGIAVFNFQVEGYHTYYVHQHGTRGTPVLVHSANYPSTKPVLLGRNMRDRGKPVARSKSYDYYKQKPRGATKNNIDRQIANNERWLNDQIKSGRPIYDIGAPKGYSPSRFYDAEHRLLRDSGYRMQRRGRVKVNDEFFQLFEWVK